MKKFFHGKSFMFPRGKVSLAFPTSINGDIHVMQRPKGPFVIKTEKSAEECYDVVLYSNESKRVLASFLDKDGAKDASMVLFEKLNGEKLKMFFLFFLALILTSLVLG